MKQPEGLQDENREQIDYSFHLTHLSLVLLLERILLYLLNLFPSRLLWHVFAIGVLVSRRHFLKH
tara:strand:- start:610 stop:804 length:195 start_codon:yes stop_codon:yes gene_type:complete